MITRIPLGEIMKEHGRCQQCSEPLGRYGIAHNQLRGLYCSERCTLIALRDKAGRLRVKTMLEERLS